MLGRVVFVVAVILTLVWGVCPDPSLLGAAGLFWMMWATASPKRREPKVEPDRFKAAVTSKRVLDLRQRYIEGEISVEQFERTLDEILPVLMLDPTTPAPPPPPPPNIGLVGRTTTAHHGGNGHVWQKNGHCECETCYAMMPDVRKHVVVPQHEHIFAIGSNRCVIPGCTYEYAYSSLPGDPDEDY